MRGRRIILGTIGIVLGVWLWAAPGALGGGYVVTAECTSGGQTSACSSGWYTSNVSLSWTWRPNNDGSNPTAGCVPHSYVVDTSATASCTITGPAGQTATSQPIHVEKSTPSVVVDPSRPGDSNGWYNHPVTATVSGSSFSGIASCTPDTYSGPDSTSATVGGSCTDNAGKKATAASKPFPYDATPPPLRVFANSGDQVAFLGWNMTDIAPSAGFRIVRQPGLGRRSWSVVYRGPGRSFKDTRVRNGVHYRYTITARDVAGNTSAQSIIVKPGRRLLLPVNGTQLTEPPLLVWTAVRRAAYYNVQLYRGNRKVLSVWPDRARLQLASTWSIGRRHYRLRPGTYRWYVWPGFGRRSAARYGPPIGHRIFIVMQGT